MKSIVTVCFAVAFTQVVAGGEVRNGRRTIRQSFENADDGQLQQPPVASQSLDTASISSANVAADAQNTQPAQTVSSSAENNQLAASSLAPSQIPSNPATASFGVSDFTSPSSIPAQIPLPSSPPLATPPLASFNPMVSVQNAQPAQTVSSPNALGNNQLGVSFAPNPTIPNLNIPDFSHHQSNHMQISPPCYPSLLTPPSTPFNPMVLAQNPQAVQIPSSNTLENNQLARSSSAPSQIPPNPTVATFTIPNFTTPSNFPAQIPPPNWPPSPTPSLTPFNPTVSINGNPAGVAAASSIPGQATYPYDPAMNFGRSAAYPQTPYANPQQSPHNSYYPQNPYYPQYPQYLQNPIAYTNPQMMYGMPSSYPPTQYMPPVAQPPQMINGQFPYTGNFTNPRSASPYPYPANNIPAPSATDELATPTIMSSTGESGTDMNSLPPQVKEFMDMIPQILSMHDSPQTPNPHEIKRPPLRKLPKLPSSLLKKKQYYQSNYPSSAYSEYLQRNGYYY